MPIIPNTIAGGLAGLLISAGCWRRKKEVDGQGNPCAKYFLLSYVFAIGSAFFLYAGIDAALDPVLGKHPANMVVLLGLSAISLGLFLFFWRYRISIQQHHIECTRWPWKTRQFNQQALTFIGTKRREYVLHFAGGETLVIPLFASGQQAVVERLEALIAARTDSSFRRHGKAKRRR